ncbi:hypothetical protein V8F33_013855 [Rhypophila sp. PSN 637]
MPVKAENNEFHGPDGTTVDTKKDVIEGHVHFLARSPIYELEKPYSLRFPPVSGLPQSNIDRENHALLFRNMRDLEGLSLERNGFDVLGFRGCSMGYADFEDDVKVRDVYLREVCLALKARLGATRVIAVDFVIRRRHPTFPVSTGRDYDHDQPTAMAHVDFTLDEGTRMLSSLFGTRADKVTRHGWQVINAWKPLRGPINDWPLGICDASTVDHEHDTVPSDIVYEGWVTENMQVHYNPDQTWYYLPDHTIDEVLIFKSAESDPGKSQATPHSGFHNPHADENEVPRESIDARFLVLYAPADDYPPVVGGIFPGLEGVLQESGIE